MDAVAGARLKSRDEGVVTERLGYCRSLGCWPWLGALARPDGRALVHDLGWPTQAARVAWQLSHAPVPDGLQVLHLCDHPWCMRPTHLVLGSQAANMADRARKQ